MARYNNFPEINSPPEPFDSALRVGRVRVRPYKSGSVKHAHVVLKKVAEEVYVDSAGKQRTKGVFSFFAHKVINCKPGKEIFFALDNYLQEHVVAFEADLYTSNDADNDARNSAKSDETLVQQSKSLPPKMRKMWARRESVAVKQDTPNHSVREKVSVGVQADPIPVPVHIPTQMTPSSISDGKGPLLALSATDWPPFMPSTTAIQSDAIALQNQPPPALLPTLSLLQSKDEIDSTSPDVVSTSAGDRGTMVDPATKIAFRSGSRERSLSPMELESTPSSPRYSPEPPVAQVSSVENKTNSWDRGNHGGTPRLIQADSAATLVESSPIKVKEEPTDIALPSSPPAKPKPASRSFRAPVFVPARHNPFKQKADTSERASSPSSAPPVAPPAFRPTVAVTPTPLTVLKKTAPVAGTATGPSKSGSASSITFPLQEPHTLISPSPALAPTTIPSASRATRHAPTFVPATQLSQRTEVSRSEVRSMGGDSAIPPTTPEHQYERPAPVEGFSVSENDTSRKRKRMHTDATELSVPEPQVNGADVPSKKWRPIIKQEPQSPVLSALSLLDPKMNGFGRPELPQSLPLSVSIPPFAPPMHPSPAASQVEYSKMPSPVVKAEPMDYVPLSFDSESSRPSPTTPYRSSKTFIDLTNPRLYRDRAPLSAPVKRFNKSRRSVAGVASSLPIIRTAQVKMDSARRDAVGVRAIVFDPTGNRFAVICRDNSIRIWDNVSCVEIAKLAHSSSVISAVWMHGETSIASMGSNGIVSKWSLVGKNKWMWEKLVDTGDVEPSCFAYYRHRIAVATSRGVRIWEYENGHWATLGRDVPRRDVLSIRFVNDGSELLCACSDGNLINYSILMAEMQPVTKFKTKVFHVDTDPTSTRALIAQALGSAHLVDITAMDRRAFGRVLQDYSLREAEEQYGARGVHGFKPILTDYGDAVVFGSIEGRVLVWDRRRGQIIYEMDHGDNVLVQAVASFDGENGDQHLVSCTKYGLLTWWRLPIRIF